MSTDMLSVVLGQFCTMTPSLLVWLVAAMLCAYRYERAPVRFFSLGVLLAIMVVGSVSLPFIQYMIATGASSGFVPYNLVSLIQPLLGLVSTVVLTVLPPIALVTIGLLTASPPPRPPET